MTQLPALRPDSALQFRILFGPAPSLHEFRSGRGRLVRSLLCYFGQVRSFALILGYGLRPSRQRPGLD